MINKNELINIEQNLNIGFGSRKIYGKYTFSLKPKKHHKNKMELTLDINILKKLDYLPIEMNKIKSLKDSVEEKKQKDKDTPVEALIKKRKEIIKQGLSDIEVDIKKFENSLNTSMKKILNQLKNV